MAKSHKQPHQNPYLARLIKRFKQNIGRVRTFLDWLNSSEDDDETLEEGISLFFKAVFISVSLILYYIMVCGRDIVDCVELFWASIGVAYVDIFSVVYLWCGYCEALI